MKRSLAIFLQIFMICTLSTHAWGLDQYKQCVDSYEGKDFAGAHRFCREAKDSNARFLMGEMYYHGLGVKEDHSQAAAWYRKSAEQGNCEGQFRIGHMYYYGVGVKEDHAEALKWFRKAALQGNPRARVWRDQILHKDKSQQNTPAP